MEFMNLVNKRWSCRKYLDKQVPRELIERCLDAARLAPSACNSEPWHFIVVDNYVVKNKVADAAFSNIFGMNKFAKDAPVLVIVVREKSKYIATMGGFLRNIQYSLIDIGIACEHFVLQATQEGLGTCYLGWFNEKGVKKVLNIRRNTKIDLIISLGYSDEIIRSEKKRKVLSEIIEFR